jgi:hypothetical protein
MGVPLEELSQRKKSEEGDDKQQPAQAKPETIGAQQAKRAESKTSADTKQQDDAPRRCCSACGVLFAGHAHSWLTLTFLSGPFL